MIPKSIQRFILTSIDSVPHLEALLLFRTDPKKGWDARMISQALFINEMNAEKILDDLCCGQFISHHERFYLYDPLPEGLKKIIDALAETYAQNLIEVTKLIHSKTNKQAQQFGDAFKWREE